MNKTLPLNNSQTWKVSAVSPLKFAPTLEEIFQAHIEETPTITSFEIIGDINNNLIEAYFNNQPDAVRLESALKEMARVFNVKPPALEIETLDSQDWVSQSQKLLKPIDAGRFYLYGKHDAEKVPPESLSILMEAGQAFGTGSHETTKGCLLAISERHKKIEPQSILDLGCGSGVLAIAMAKQWETKIIASDIDPIATQTTIENINVNNVKLIECNQNKNGIGVVTCDGFEQSVLQDLGPYDLIVANILAGPLVFMAEDIVLNLEAGGQIILSGLLKTQEKDVLTAYEEQGMILTNSYPINEWQTLLLSKPHIK